MSQFERIYTINRLLGGKRAVPLSKFMETLEVSKATVKRDLEYLRSRLGAPLVYDREQHGYRYDQDQSGATPPFQLPGFWLTSDELHALLFLRDLLEQIDSRFLSSALEPAVRKFESLLDAGKLKARDLSRRFRLIHARHRPVEEPIFRVVSSAVVQRKRLELTYFSRSRGEILPRTVSPQRLIWYSSNWYLDAWCHLRNDFRSFSLDAIRGATLLAEKADEYPPEVLDARLGAGYGIFAGPPDKTAVLRFRLPASRWVEREEWHPKQRLTHLPGSEVRLEVPYSDPRELVQDILRFVPDIVVESPETLRAVVAGQLEEGLARLRAEMRKPAAGEARLSMG